MKGIWKYRHLLPDVGESFQCSLGEGGTPLVRSRRLGASLGLENLYFKLETVNPSGSYKDRFAACAVAGLQQHGARICLATSSGNTGAALAAYCAAADISCYLILVDGAPRSKVQQMQVYGAQTMTVKDFGKNARVTEAVFSALDRLGEDQGTRVQISAYRHSPLGMAGVQTLAYELAEELPDESVHVFSPAGGGGLTLALAKGFQIWQKQFPDFKMPKLHCVQPVGNNTISGPLRSGLESAVAVAQSTTMISGLQVPNVIDGDQVVPACRASGGTGYLVTDELIWESQKSLAVREGIFCEPAGAVGFAGLVTAIQQKEVKTKDHIVCLVTGHGFKDSATAAGMVAGSAIPYFEHTEDTIRYILSRTTKK